MRTTLLATAVAAALTLAAVEASAAPGSAATKAEIQAMQAQMEALAARLGKLEAANTALQAENSELRSVVERRDAETDYLKAQTKDLREEGAVNTNELSKLKGADWASRIKFKGDFRMRDENIETAAGGRADHWAEDPGGPGRGGPQPCPLPRAIRFRRNGDGLDQGLPSGWPRATAIRARPTRR